VSFLERFKDNKEIAEENSRIRRGKKAVERELLETEEKLEEITDKYILLLEEKGEGFNQYIHYHDLCVELNDTVKKNKKEMADLKNEIKQLTSIISEKDEIITKIEKENKKLNKKINKIE